MTDYYPVDTTSTPALVMRALAEYRDGAPYTAQEIASLITDEIPVDAESEKDAGAISRRCAYLYQKHAIDRRERESESGSPYEYWLAGRGRFIASKEGWLPEADGPADLRENPGPDALLSQVGEVDEEGEEQIVDDIDGLNAALKGLANTLKDHEETLETLKGDAVMAEELALIREEIDDRPTTWDGEIADRMDAITERVAALEEQAEEQAGESAVDTDLREDVDHLAETVETLRKQVNNLGQAIEREQEGEDEAFARAIRNLRRLESEGYYPHEVEVSETRGGYVAEVRVSARHPGERERRQADYDTEQDNPEATDGPK
jgi:hypothetical protein